MHSLKTNLIQGQTVVIILTVSDADHMTKRKLIIIYYYYSANFH
jgi:hypothetical protein